MAGRRVIVFLAVIRDFVFLMLSPCQLGQRARIRTLYGLLVRRNNASPRLDTSEWTKSRNQRDVPDPGFGSHLQCRNRRDAVSSRVVCLLDWVWRGASLRQAKDKQGKPRDTRGSASVRTAHLRKFRQGVFEESSVALLGAQLSS